MFSAPTGHHILAQGNAPCILLSNLINKDRYKQSLLSKLLLVTGEAVAP